MTLERPGARSVGHGCRHAAEERGGARQGLHRRSTGGNEAVAAEGSACGRWSLSSSACNTWAFLGQFSRSPQNPSPDCSTADLKSLLVSTVRPYSSLNHVTMTMVGLGRKHLLADLTGGAAHPSIHVRCMCIIYYQRPKEAKQSTNKKPS
jgi:hypothetical protein